jgi:hypothetical protein
MTSLTCCGRIIVQKTELKTTTIMEDVMNTKQLAITAMMLFVATEASFAQSFYPKLKKYSSADKQRIEKIYASTLASDNKGVVESALTIAIKMKLDLPEDEFPMLSAKIERLMSLSTTPSIRYKAFIASAVFSHPDQFRNIIAQQYDNPADLFDVLAGESGQITLSEK